MCRGYSNEKYKELIKKSRERWEARKDTTIKRGEKIHYMLRKHIWTK